MKRQWASAAAGFVVGAAMVSVFFLTVEIPRGAEDSNAQGLGMGRLPSGLTSMRVSSATPDTGPMAQIQAIKQQLERNPEDRDALMALANANMMIKRQEEAEALYNRVLELYPRHLDARTNLALIRLDQGSPQEAVRLLEKNLETSPEDDATLFNLGVIYLYDLKDPEKALKVWERWLGAHPQAINAETIRQKVEQIKAGLTPPSAG